MILRRLTTSLHEVSTNVRDQNWTAIAIEFVLVVLGVFLGVAAANWNEERLERRETRMLLGQIGAEIAGNLAYMESVDDYYDSAGAYAERAIAGWGGDPTVSDAEFVIAAYQASQVTGVGFNSNVWGAIFGAESLRDIDNPVVRQNLARVMTYDYATMDLRSVSSRYREETRKTIPNDIQAAIRESCGDRAMRGGILVLPRRCDLQLSDDKAAQAATALRSRPELVSELHWHQAAVANQQAQMDVVRQFFEGLAKSIGSSP